MVPVLNQANPLHNVTNYFFNIHFNIFLFTLSLTNSVFYSEYETNILYEKRFSIFFEYTVKLTLHFF
jgi:hypothetical protein